MTSWVTTQFCEMANGGIARLSGGGPPITRPLEQYFGQFGPTGIRAPSTGASYQFDLVPPGAYTLTLEHSSHTFTPYFDPAISLPDLGSPGSEAGSQLSPWGAVPLSFPTYHIWGADYAGTDTVRFRFFNKINGEDELQFETSAPNVFKVDDLGDRLFLGGPNDGSFRMRAGTWTLWVGPFNDKWYKTGGVISTNTGAEHVIDVHLDVPAPESLPEQEYTLKVQAVNDADRNFRIGGVKVNFGGPGGPITTVAGGFFTVAGHKGAYLPISVTHDIWAHWADDAEFSLASGTPVITVTARMIRGMTVRGAVNETGFPASFLPGVEVGVTNRFGSRIATLVTDGAGQFGVTPAYAIPFAEVGFIDINHPGYYPVRMRFVPDGSGPPGSPVNVVLPVSLTPYPRPIILTAAIDRLGPFLPGVSKGDAVTGPDPDLEGQFSVLAEAQNVIITLPGYDAPDGSPGAPSEQTIVDEITEITLVDPRSFPNNPFLDAPVAVPPSNLDQARGNDGMRAWFNAAVGVGPDATPNMFVSRSGALTAAGPPRQLSGTGEVSLWKLPPGLFRPVAVVRTRNGAWNYQVIAHTGMDDYRNLYGLAIPPWLAGVADILGTVAAIQALPANTAERVNAEIQFDNFLPEGLLKAIPDFSGTITKDGAGFITYEYAIAAQLRDGMDLPGDGWLAAMPGYEGIDVDGYVRLTVEGDVIGGGGSHAARLSLSGGAGAAVEIEGEVPDHKFAENQLNAESYLPSWLAKSDKAKLLSGSDFTFAAEGGASLTSRRDFVRNNAVELGVAVDTFGFVQAGLHLNVTPVVETIPQIGPIVRAINTTSEKALAFFVNMAAGIGGTHQTEFTTVFPRVIEFPAGGTYAPDDPTPYPLSRHFLGGADVKSKRTVCLFLSLGMSVKAFHDRLGAGGDFKLTGNNCRPPSIPGPPQPSLQFTLNEKSDWPLFTRIDGKLTGSLNAYLNLWAVKLQKEWTFLSIDISHQFNTEPVFSLCPILITTRSVGISDGEPAVYTGLAPALLRRLSPLGAYTVAPGAPDTLAFVDIDPATSSMVLKAARRTGVSTWGAPVTIASAAAMLQPALVSYAGGWMLVWTEISAAAVGNVTPPSTLRFSTSADGVTWSTPATIAILTGVAVNPRLLPLPGGALGLVFLESHDGPTSEAFDLKAVPFSGGAWGSVQTILTETTLRGFDAAGTGATPAEIVLVDAADALKAISWDGASAAPAATLAASGAAAPLALAAAADNTFVLASGFTGGAGLGVYRKIPPVAWAPLSPAPIPAGTPQHAVVQPTTVAGITRYLVAWTGGGAPATLSHAWLDDTGAIAAGHFDLTGTVAGSYGTLSAVPHAGAHEATLFSQFDNGSGTLELRAFDVSLAGGSINHDRDGDTLEDRAELRIVDADTDDAIVTIDDVLARADFDGDGFTNAAEPAAATDPTNPSSFPGKRVGIEAGVADCHEFGTVPGIVTIYREGDGATPLTVHYAVSGSATNGTDYETLPDTLTFAVGEYAREVLVVPLGDSVAEGPETATLTLTPDAAYTVSATAPGASVTIRDLPMDDWRFANFTPAELLDAAISGDFADAESDGRVNLLEYAFALPPKLGTGTGPVAVTLVNPATGAAHLGLMYVRPTGALDLVFACEISENLAQWRPAGSDVETVSITPNGDGTETIVIRDTLPVSAQPLRFRRLGVSRSSP